MLDQKFSDAYGSILAIEHESIFLKRVKNYLEDSGFKVYETNDAAAGLALFHQYKPDLVLSALDMKIEDAELIDLIKEESPDTPVIIIAQTEAVDDFLQAMTLGAWDYIIKPVTNMSVLEHSVCRTLERGRLVTENKRYRKALEEKNEQLRISLRQLEEDQKAGKSVQQQLLPQTKMTFGEYSFTHKILPSLYLSGDFVDYFQIDDNRVGFYIADVSGHGASSAFVTILLKNIINNHLSNYKLGNSHIILEPESLLSAINNEIIAACLGKYATIVYGVIHTKENTLTYAVGGHYPYPIFFDGKVASFLKCPSFFVGKIKSASYKRYVIDLPPSCSLTLLSDGIFEVLTEDSLEKKEQVLLAVFSSFCGHMEEVMKQLGVQYEGKFPDDITFLRIDRLSK